MSALLTKPCEGHRKSFRTVQGGVALSNLARFLLRSYAVKASKT